MDVTSWQGLLLTLLSVALVALIGVGIRLLMMVTVQQRRERMNRQINERLRTLIAAYKVLGGSFTGDLRVDPTHLADLLRRQGADAEADDASLPVLGGAVPASDRSRRIRDAVEAALSDVILLGTEEHVRLASAAAQELAAGRPVHTQPLVEALRNFIRRALDLDPVPSDVLIPPQGPTRPAAGGGRNRSEGGRGEAARGGVAAEGGGAGMGLGMSLGTRDGAGGPSS